MLSFGQRLKTLRREADLSQSDLAEEIGVSVHSVSKWECDSNMPDASLLVPLSVVLGVTTDCLLGAGTNEKEDRDALRKEIEAIDATPYGKGHESRTYRIAAVIEEFLKKYPLCYGVKVEYADYVWAYLYIGKVQSNYEIPEDEFEQLWSKGFKALISVKNHDNDPTRLSHSRYYLARYYDLIGEYEKAEEIAAELPEYPIKRLDALIEIAGDRRDFDKQEIISVAEAIESYEECSHYMWQRARAISIFGQVRKEEAIAAWRDALRITFEYDRVFGKSWPYSDLNSIIGYRPHPKMIASDIYFGLIGDLLALERTDEALDALEELTDMGINHYEELKEKLALGQIDRKDFTGLLEIIKGFPRCSYNGVIKDDCNFFTREERFKACKARIDALE